MRRKPSSAVCRLGASSCSRVPMRPHFTLMRNEDMAPAAASTADATNGHVGAPTYRKPEITGAAMRADWNEAEVIATRRGRESASTTSAYSARDAGAANARATPYAALNAKIGPTAVGSVLTYQASAAEHRTSPDNAIRTTVRRSKRSATWPVTSTRIAAGANSASPTNPRSSSRSVVSNTNFPSATA